MSNATLKGKSGKRDDMARIVGEIDEQFDAWNKNQKTGAAQKIDEKKEHFCPLCGSKVEKEVDASHMDAMKDGLERAKKESFSEMEEQVKFVKALEDAIKQRNEELEMETKMDDLSEKRVEDLISVDIPKRKRRVVKAEPSPAVPKKIAVPKSIWVHDEDNRWKEKEKEKHRRKEVEVIHRVPLPGDFPQVIHRVPLPGDFPDTIGGASWPYYGTNPKQKFKLTRTML